MSEETPKVPIPTTTLPIEVFSDETIVDIIKRCDYVIARDGEEVDAYFPKTKARLEDPEALLKGPNVTIPNELVDLAAPKIMADIAAFAEKHGKDHPHAVKATARMAALESR